MRKEPYHQKYSTEHRKLYAGKCEIHRVAELAVGIYSIRFFAPVIAHSAHPGQFLQVRVSESYDPLLRRPFSVHRLQRKRGEVEILFKVVGRGTEILARKEVGWELDVIGPLGRGFAIEGAAQNFLLLAGGMGVAPLFFAAEELLHQGKKVVFFAGFKNKDLVCRTNDLQRLGTELHVATEDGSSSFEGTVIELFKDYLKKEKLDKKHMILACGPTAMLKELAECAQDWDLTCQVSLEDRMACGVGACMGCPIKVKHSEDDDPYKLICRDGPVFYLEEICLDG